MDWRHDHSGGSPARHAVPQIVLMEPGSSDWDHRRPRDHAAAAFLRTRL